MVEKGINFVFVDNDYIDVMDMKIIKGRDFDPELSTDLEESIIINEACANVLGWGEDPISKNDIAVFFKFIQEAGIDPDFSDSKK